MRVLLLCIALFSCSPSIQYLGDQYTPTETVDFYYSKDDISRSYRVMGIILNEADEYNDLEDVRLAILEKSKHVGADGILFEAVTNETIGKDSYLINKKPSYFFFRTLFEEERKGVVLRAKLLKYN